MASEQKCVGYIYILTNRSFPDYVKIGYTDNLERRLKNLNNSECTPFAFRLYAYYEVDRRLTDLKVHEMIDRLNPELRSIDTVNGKTRVREFYAMSKEDAYMMFEAIAQINGLEDKLHKMPMTEEEKKENDLAEAVSTSRAGRFNFSKLGIKPGSILQYIGDENITCEVVDDRKVSYNGETMYLSHLTFILKGNKGSYNGAMFFKYNGELISDIRARLGQ